jgi:hypothetical protein
VESSPFTGIRITPGLLFVVANSVVMQGLTGRSAGSLARLTLTRRYGFLLTAGCRPSFSP